MIVNLNGLVPGGAEQAWHDALEAVVRFYGLDIKVDMSPLPEDFDIKKTMNKRGS